MSTTSALDLVINNVRESIVVLHVEGDLDSEAIRIRNEAWVQNPLIPSWVSIESVPLDQFFTVPSVAKKCYKNMIAYLRSEGVGLRSVAYLEPSAGRGAFLNLMPPSLRIGLDVMPQTDDTICADFLSWEPEPTDLPIVVIGNPPFGYRAWLALEFLNHAATFADYVGFILPMAFQSDGKGSPKPRVRGMHLVHQEILPAGSFVDGNDRPVKINALWQIWKSGEVTTPDAPTCDSWIDLFTVDERKERLCGQTRMAEADYFLQRTFFRDAPSLVRTFSEVRYVCGYGIVIKRDKRRVTSILNNVDWRKYSNLAAHNCNHISMYHIRRALTDMGLVDD
ncbi:MAG: hypothetical protein ACYDB2_07640 [Acidimicrobiales bacterium]